MTISIMASIWDSRNRWSHDDEGYDWCGQDDHPVGNPKRKVWWVQ
jgi:hypothetical protein